MKYSVHLITPLVICCFINCNSPKYTLVKTTSNFRWTELPGVGADIAGGVNDPSLYYVGCPTTTRCGNQDDGHEIYKFNFLAGWQQIGGFAYRISTDNEGNVWVINKSLKIFKRNPIQTSNWTQIPGDANDITCGPSGGIWIIGKGKFAREGGIFKYSHGVFVPYPGGGIGVRIAVDRQGNPWIVTKNGEIYKGENNSWTNIPGPLAEDIAIGMDGVVWIMGKRPVNNGYCVYRKGINGWESYPLPLQYSFVYGGAISTVNNIVGNIPVVIIDRMDVLRQAYGEPYYGKMFRLGRP
jgi:hypothetical protein